MTKILTIDSEDNLDFISNIEIIIQDRINIWKPPILAVTKIDNWFDEKWRNFSGKIMPGLSIWKGETTVPPFNPNRVISSIFYRRNGESNDYQKISNDTPLHINQASQDNLNRKITDFVDHGLLIWYSGNTKKNNIGSLMGYYIHNNDCFTFYMTLSQEKSWGISKSIGLTRKDVENILSINSLKNS